MIDYVRIIADKIKSGIPVAFYTVGGDTFSVMRALKHRFGVKPAAVCDRDTAKQGRAYRGLDGVPVMSFEDTNSRFPNAEYFISSMDYRFEIMGELTSSGKLDCSKIINYEPVERRVSCIFWEKLTCLHADQKFTFCWEAGSPSVSFKRDMRDAALEFSDLRNDFISGAKGLSQVCDNCGYVKEDWYPVLKKMWWINYFAQGICNYKCKYCVAHLHATEEIGGYSPYLGDVIETLRSVKLLSDQYSMILSTRGEPTLHSNRKEFYSAFDGYALIVNTNGSTFDRDLFALMQDKLVRLIVSIDAGTSATYMSIKGLDYFERVLDNLKKYQEAALGMVVPKYVVTSGINDNEADVDGFCAICADLNVPYAIAAYDMYSPRPVPKQSVDMLLRLKRNLENNGMLCAPYTECYTYEYVQTLSKVFI